MKSRVRFFPDIELFRSILLAIGFVLVETPGEIREKRDGAQVRARKTGRSGGHRGRWSLEPFVPVVRRIKRYPSDYYVNCTIVPGTYDLHSEGTLPSREAGVDRGYRKRIPRGSTSWQTGGSGVFSAIVPVLARPGFADGK